MTYQRDYGDECWERNYKNGRYNRYPYDDIVSFTLKNFKNRSNVLDLGCGGGNNSFFFINEGHKVFAVDGSETALELTKKHCLNNSDLICLHNDFKNMSIESETIDLIVDRQSMGHNSRNDIIEILNELHRVLKVGGKILSHMFSRNHKALSRDSYIGDDFLLKFSSGELSKSGYIYFTDKEDITKLFWKFKLIELRRMFTESLINDESIEYFVIEAEKV